MTAPVAAVPGDGVAAPWEYMGQALPVVLGAAKAIVALPVLPAVPGLPDLSTHASAAHDLATGFLSTTGPASQSALDATARWSTEAANVLDDLLRSLDEGNVRSWTLLKLRISINNVSATAATLQAQQSPLADLDAESARVGGLLAADTQAVQRTATLTAQDQTLLTAQAAQLQKKIENDHQTELLGLLAGPLGYLAAREIGDLVDDVDGLERQIADLQQRAGADGQAIAALGSVAGPLSALSQAANHLGVGLQALVDGWSVLLGFLRTTQTAFTTAGTDPPVALIPDLTAASSALHRLADASTAQGQPS